MFLILNPVAVNIPRVIVYISAIYPMMNRTRGHPRFHVTAALGKVPAPARRPCLIDQNMGAGGDGRYYREVYAVPVTLHLYINGNRRIPVDILVKIKQVRESGVVPARIGNSFRHLPVIRHVPEHTLFKPVGIGIPGVLVPELHCLGKKATVPFGERTRRVVKFMSLDIYYHVARPYARGSGG